MSGRDASSERDAYHHGDLRRALPLLALDLDLDLVLEPRTSSSKLEPRLRSSNLVFEPGTSNLEPRTWNLEPGTSNLDPGTSNLTADELESLMPHRHPRRVADQRPHLVTLFEGTLDHGRGADRDATPLREQLMAMSQMFDALAAPRARYFQVSSSVVVLSPSQRRLVKCASTDSA